jgi:hypothetical protein
MPKRLLLKPLLQQRKPWESDGHVMHLRRGEGTGCAGAESRGIKAKAKAKAFVLGGIVGRIAAVVPSAINDLLSVVIEASKADFQNFVAGWKGRVAGAEETKIGESRAVVAAKRVEGTMSIESRVQLYPKKFNN